MAHKYSDDCTCNACESAWRKSLWAAITRTENKIHQGRCWLCDGVGVREVAQYDPSKTPHFWSEQEICPCQHKEALMETTIKAGIIILMLLGLTAFLMTAITSNNLGVHLLMSVISILWVVMMLSSYNCLE